MNKMTGCLAEALESATFCPDSFGGHRATTIGAEFFLAHVVDDSAVLSGEISGTAWAASQADDVLIQPLSFMS